MTQRTAQQVARSIAIRNAIKARAAAAPTRSRELSAKAKAARRGYAIRAKMAKKAAAQAA